MRGRATDSVTGEIGTQNPFSEWTADGDSAELWQMVDDGQGGLFAQLTGGGKHYGHLEINVERVVGAEDLMAEVTFTPVYSFPLLDSDGALIDDQTIRRIYADQVTLSIGTNVAVFPEPASGGLMVFAALALCSIGRKSRRRLAN